MEKTASVQPVNIGAWLASRWAELHIPAPMFVIVVGVAVLPIINPSDYAMHLLVTVLLAGAQAMIFDLTAGYINANNFGFAAFVGLGGYTSAVLAVHLGISPWYGVLAGAGMSALLGFITGVLTLRQRGIYVSLVAWFAGLAIMAVATAWVQVTRGPWGLEVPPLYASVTPRAYVYILLVVLVVAYVIMQALVQSDVGLAFQAIGQNFDAARASGVNPTLYKVINFTLSCALAGLIGGFYAHFVGILTPSTMGTSFTIEILVLCYVGGRGSLWGGLAAACLFIPVFDYLKQYLELRLIIYGIALIATMIFYPTGMAGMYNAVVRLVQRRKGN